MSSTLIAYRQEVFNFLQTVSIKYLPLATAINQNLINQGIAVDPDDQTTWKYYMNLCGDYHPTDEMMYIQSIDTQEQVPFTKATLINHPRTRKVYVPGTIEYQELCARYAHQVDLVKSIVYPVLDINNAVSAENLSIISYGDGLVEEWEIDSIIGDINIFLDYLANRWYFSHFSYEVLYPWAFYGMMWSMLAECIFSTRIKNLQTNAVHTFHIWEKLTSEGLGDYRDILNRQQSLFLYQNIDYIKANRGKQSNLRLLVDSLLDPIAIGMVGKIVYQTTDPAAAEECRWIPEFVSERVPTRYADILQQIPTESMTVMAARLYESGLEVDKSNLSVDQQERDIGATTLNTFPSKVLEIRPISIDRQYADILYMFILDNLVNMVNRDAYNPQVFIVDGPTGSELRLTAKDALALYYYCVQRTKRQTPVNLPTKYTSWAAFRPGLETEDRPTTFVYAGARYNYNSLVNVDKFMQDTNFPPGPIHLSTDFAEMLGRQFLSRIRQIEMSRITSDHMVIQALKRLDLFVSDRKQHTISLSTTPDYDTWLVEKGLDSLVAFYDLAGDNLDKYRDLSYAIMEELIPINTTILRRYALETTTKEFYTRLKELFFQLCSYNVVFIDTSRDTEHWVRLPKTTLYSKSIEIQTEQQHDVSILTRIDTSVESFSRYKGTEYVGLRFGIDYRWHLESFSDAQFRQTQIGGTIWCEDTLRLQRRNTDLSTRTGIPFYMNVKSILDPTALTF